MPQNSHGYHYCKSERPCRDTTHGNLSIFFFLVVSSIPERGVHRDFKRSFFGVSWSKCQDPTETKTKAKYPQQGMTWRGFNKATRNPA